ncbi:hypothetical protein [Streptacidiphilus sp. P02-A3a]|uniref:hypothetical protein n=1 Tax=Streptacidiphilus sp. P02-A3a TaxID=2704468 RepID=UPI0015FCF90B|nr:hypothetical protein [Streptacidiphilus sp. P02-A3a]QMU67082.1 hypothetical protein GXP74_01510 [Streptacidiphilus sp. P02-A3a]
MSVQVESNSYLTEEQQRVYQLRSSLERNGGTPVGFLDVLAAVIAEDTWRKVPSGVNKEEPFTSFADFIEAKPPFGLGAKVADVLVLLQIRHPHEGVEEIRDRMDAMRAEVRRLLTEDGITGYTEDQRDRDIKAWAALDRSGGWWLAFFVACQVEMGKGHGSSRGSVQRLTHGLDGSTKITAQEFAERAGTTAKRVVRYYRAWEAATSSGAVSIGPELLYPGHSPIELPPVEDWSLYYRSRATSGSSEERQQAIAEAAAGEGIKPTMALHVAENPTALRAAILADPKTAQVARAAISDLTVNERSAKHAEYVRQAAGEGQVTTAAGQVIQLPEQARGRAAVLLTAVEDAKATPESVTEAFEAVQGLIAEAVEADPEIQIREQRTRFTKALSSTKKGIESIDLDDLAAVADDDLRGSIAELQKKVNELADLIGKPRSSTLRAE